MNQKQSISVEGTVRNKPNFGGPFFRWYVNYNINRENRTCDRFVVFSSGKRHAVVKYLWHKLVWDTLTKEEYYFFLTLPEVLQDNKITGFLQSILTYPKSTIRRRLNLVERLLGEKETSPESYMGLKRLRIELVREQIRLPKTQKFSGYVRNISSLGKGSGRGTGVPEPIPYIYVDTVEDSNWYYLLTVGEITLLSQVVILP
jgi:hypothetical protein